MGTFKKVCKNLSCRKEFMGARTQQYCCPDCRSSSRKQQPSKNCTIEEVAKKAKSNGTSYGKYVAMLYLSERKIR